MNCAKNLLEPTILFNLYTKSFRLRLVSLIVAHIDIDKILIALKTKILEK